MSPNELRGHVRLLNASTMTPAPTSSQGVNYEIHKEIHARGNYWFHRKLKKRRCVALVLGSSILRFLTSELAILLENDAHRLQLVLMQRIELTHLGVSLKFRVIQISSRLLNGSLISIELGQEEVPVHPYF